MTIQPTREILRQSVRNWIANRLIKRKYSTWSSLNTNDIVININYLWLIFYRYSDAIEYYGAIDDNEMCIDLNMRMQSVLVRPYILDCLCEHNQLSKKDQKGLLDQLHNSTAGHES